MGRVGLAEALALILHKVAVVQVVRHITVVILGLVAEVMAVGLLMMALCRLHLQELLAGLAQ
jgi:hypothetical protein